jgi:hypothetical protein
MQLKRLLIAGSSLLALILSISAQGALTVYSPFGGDGFLAPGETPFPASPGDSAQRGIAFSPVTNHVYVVNRTGSLAVNVLNANTGASAGNLNVTGISGGTFALNQIRVATDGAIYAANLESPASGASLNLKIYRWANEAAAPTTVLDTPMPASFRFGDDMALRGTGANTLMVFGQNTTNVTLATNLLFVSTADGNTFTPQVITVAPGAGGTPVTGDFKLGIAFAEGNSIIAKGQAGNLRKVSFDLTGAGTATLDASAGGFASNFTGFDYDPVSKQLIGGTTQGTAPVTSFISLYDLSNFTSPVLVDTVNYPTANTNSNAAGASQFANNGVAYVLNTNNGIGAISVPEPAATALLAGATVLLARCRRPGRRA